jgi:hypothetical protein
MMDVATPADRNVVQKDENMLKYMSLEYVELYKEHECL